MNIKRLLSILFINTISSWLFLIYAQNIISFNEEMLDYGTSFSLQDWVHAKVGDNVNILGNDTIINLKRNSLNNVNKANHDGWEHLSIDLYYKGIPLEYNSINVHKKDGYIVSMNGNYFPLIDVNTTPLLSESEALSFALNHINAMEYSWTIKPTFLSEHNDTKYLLEPPVPQLVICPNYAAGTKEATLAYKIEIFSIIPFEHQYIYVDANRGNIIHVQHVMKQVNGIAQTRYSGTQTISTLLQNNLYYLIDQTRGDGIYTYVYDTYNNPYILTDSDNNWTASEYHLSKADAALDAHWGAMKTYDFFKSEYNRNGIDNAGLVIRNYVNYPWMYNNGDNAYWNPNTKSMYYGMGYSLFDAVVALDVIAHELGHGITDSYKSNMLYSGETGAINESLSDIWGACVEYYAAPNKEHWKIGEDITLTTDALRYMDNPKSGNQPDTYLGTNYLDPNTNNASMVVHTNSGVMNYWFYLLSDGGSGINDNGYSYSVTGIGIETAADIIYESLNYLQNEMTFAEFAQQTRQLAINLYGYCSQELQSVIDAWKAVGVTIEDIPEMKIISDLLNNGDSKSYYANTLLIANNTVKNGASALYESATRIQLNPGFHAEKGSHVVMRIIDCQDDEQQTISSRGASYVKRNNSDYGPNNHNVSILVTPNPATNYIHISGISSDRMSYIIYDDLGKLIKVGIIFESNDIDISSLKQGTYMLRLNNIENYYTYVKFIKQ